ncbi:MAG TPA: futalosine hydrolase [Mycobacteriales bacterium]|nr:futalosine hydrolase [Mycobacteriales bacterium]
MSQRLLVVCAVDQEAAALAAPFPVEPVHVGPLPARRLGTTGPVVDVVTCGIGPAAAAAAAGFALGAGDYDAVMSAGIAGAFVDGGAVVGGLAVADAIVFADLGVLTPDGFASIASLGFGDGLEQVVPPAAAVKALHERCMTTGLPVATGTLLTLATFTGTDVRAAELIGRHTAVAEAMEGSGVACAAAMVGVPALELRSISNLVGDRDREAWELPAALTALTAASAAVFASELPL